MFQRTATIILMIVWMTTIFILSAQPQKESYDLSSKVETRIKKVVPNSVNLFESGKKLGVIFIRKFAHFYLYAGLGFLSILFFRALGLKKSSLLAVLFSYIYACTDEIHQLYVPGREGKISDVGIDMLGVGTGIFLVLMIILFMNVWKKYLKSFMLIIWKYMVK